VELGASVNFLTLSFTVPLLRLGEVSQSWMALSSLDGNLFGVPAKTAALIALLDLFVGSEAVGFGEHVLKANAAP
jgi:hypothetical protein